MSILVKVGNSYVDIDILLYIDIIIYRFISTFYCKLETQYKKHVTNTANLEYSRKQFNETYLKQTCSKVLYKLVLYRRFRHDAVIYSVNKFVNTNSTNHDLYISRKCPFNAFDSYTEIYTVYTNAYVSSF